ARAWGAREPAVPSNLAKGQYTEKSREDRVDEGRHAGADKNAGTTAAPCAQPQTEEPIERGRSQWRRRVMGNRRAFVVHDRCPVARVTGEKLRPTPQLTYHYCSRLPYGCSRLPYGALRPTAT